MSKINGNSGSLTKDKKKDKKKKIITVTAVLLETQTGYL